MAVRSTQKFPQAVRRSQGQNTNHDGCQGVHRKQLIESCSQSVHDAECIVVEVGSNVDVAGLRRLAATTNNRLM